KIQVKYPLRSATKSKDDKDKPQLSLSSFASKRYQHLRSIQTRLCLFFGGKLASTLSKSMGVLDLFGKDKSAKPPRRLSIPAKSMATTRSETTSRKHHPNIRVRNQEIRYKK
ncbi:unnamed protein product, partial [Dovyalis caffra]